MGIDQVSSCVIAAQLVAGAKGLIYKAQAVRRVGIYGATEIVL